MKKILFLLILISLSSCKKEKINEIIIGYNFLNDQTLSENKSLDTIIKLTLNGDHNSLRKLNHFPCNGGASCYEKGYVITQIIYSLGEDKFIKMIDKLDRKEIFGLEGYIAVGLEYGDNDYDGKMDNKKPEIEFPKLMKKISKK